MSTRHNIKTHGLFARPVPRVPEGFSFTRRHHFLVGLPHRPSLRTQTYFRLLCHKPFCVSSRNAPETGNRTGLLDGLHSLGCKVQKILKVPYFDIDCVTESRYYFPNAYTVHSVSSERNHAFSECVINYGSMKKSWNLSPASDYCVLPITITKLGRIRRQPERPPKSPIYFRFTRNAAPVGSQNHLQ